MTKFFTGEYYRWTIERCWRRQATARLSCCEEFFNEGDDTSLQSRIIHRLQVCRLPERRSHIDGSGVCCRCPGQSVRQNGSCFEQSRSRDLISEHFDRDYRTRKVELQCLGWRDERSPSVSPVRHVPDRIYVQVAGCVSGTWDGDRA